MGRCTFIFLGNDILQVGIGDDVIENPVDPAEEPSTNDPEPIVPYACYEMIEAFERENYITYENGWNQVSAL